MSYSNDVIEALARLRDAAASSDDISNVLARAFQKLDNAGVFAALDEQTDYAAAETVLAETYLAGLREQTPDPAEVGRHRRIPVDEPLVGAEAERMRDALRRAVAVEETREDIAALETFGPVGRTAAPRPRRDCNCGQPDETRPALHAGTCPVWERHHNLR